LASFSAFYVYSKLSSGTNRAKENSGWYEVGGDTKGTAASVLGWMKADDVMEWKQTLVVEYSHPDNRKPVLMFGERVYIEKMLKSAEVDRIRQANELYQTIESPQIPPDFPVLCMEPKRAIDSQDQFYLLPILDFAPTDLGGREGRLLQITAATRRRGATTLDDSQYRTNATQPTKFTGQTLKDLKLDFVFVMDLTLSMQPFVDATLELVRKVAEEAGRLPELKAGLRLGFLGYRDSENIKDIEFTTRNFTPKLQTVTEFAETLKQVRATSVDSVDYPEDVFSGIKKGITETAWTKDAVRVLILVGDAPGHELGHEWNGAGMDEHDLRNLATESKVKLMALHLKDPDFPDQQAVAERQFRVLTKNPGAQEGHGAFFQVEGYEAAAYQKAAESFLTPVLEVVKAARETGVAAGMDDKTGGPDQAKTIARHMLHGALVEWLGKRDPAQAPRDITAWVSDKDLLNPAVQALDVKVLLTKNQLDSLKITIEQIRDAGLHGQISGQDFFSTLQAAVAAAARDPSRMRNAKSLAELGLVPDFLCELPYHSRIMAMTKTTWGSMSSDQQGNFLKELESKINFYKAVHDNPDHWQPLYQGADPDDHVAAIPLAQLP
jgi:hypothetical protein